jgi:hypothetical protein
LESTNDVPPHEYKPPVFSQPDRLPPVQMQGAPSTHPISSQHYADRFTVLSEVLARAANRALTSEERGEVHSLARGDSLDPASLIRAATAAGVTTHEERVLPQQLSDRLKHASFALIVTDHKPPQSFMYTRQPDGTWQKMDWQTGVKSNESPLDLLSTIGAQTIHVMWIGNNPPTDSSDDGKEKSADNLSPPNTRTEFGKPRIRDHFGDLEQYANPSPSV